jgi:hypothetical protein
MADINTDPNSIGLFLAAVRKHESGGNYTAYNAGGGASGGYQYIQSTWTSEANAAGYGQYAGKPASSAPPSVQDAVAQYNASNLFKEYGRWDYAAEAWYYPAWAGVAQYQNSVPYPSAGNTETIGAYGAEILKSMGGIPAGGGVNVTPVDWADLAKLQAAGLTPADVYALGGQQAGGGTNMANMTQADWQALYAAGQVPGGAQYLTAAYEAQKNQQATGIAPSVATAGNARAIINAALAELGPEFSGADMQSWAYGELTKLTAQGMDTSTMGQQVALDVQQTPEFAKAYPGIIALRNAGLPPMSVADYQSYTTSVMQAAADAGLPKGFMSKTEIGQLVANQISPAEVTQRIKNGYEAAAFASPQVITELGTYFPQIFPGGLPVGASNAGGLAGSTGPTTTGGVRYTAGGGNAMTIGTGTQGALAAYYLDPGRAYDVLINQLTQAQIGAEGVETGFGQISAGQAARLQQAGITEAEARTDFGKINKLQPLETPLPGVPGGTMSQQDLINYGFFGANPQELENVQAVRKAPFSGGGGYAQTARGTVGAGYASTQGIQGT